MRHLDPRSAYPAAPLAGCAAACADTACGARADLEGSSWRWLPARYSANGHNPDPGAVEHRASPSGKRTDVLDALDRTGCRTPDRAAVFRSTKIHSELCVDPIVVNGGCSAAWMRGARIKVSRRPVWRRQRPIAGIRYLRGNRQVRGSGGSMLIEPLTQVPVLKAVEKDRDSESGPLA